MYRALTFICACLLVLQLICPSAAHAQAWLGIGLAEGKVGATHGVEIIAVHDLGPLAGKVAPGILITHINGAPVKNVSTLIAKLRQIAVGKTISLTTIKPSSESNDGQRETTTLTITAVASPRRYSVPAECPKEKESPPKTIEMYGLAPRDGLDPVDAEIKFLKQIYGCQAPKDVISSFRKLLKIATDNKVSYPNLLFYALSPDAKKSADQKKKPTSKTKAKAPGKKSESITEGFGPYRYRLPGEANEYLRLEIRIKKTGERLSITECSTFYKSNTPEGPTKCWNNNAIDQWKGLGRIGGSVDEEKYHINLGTRALKYQGDRWRPSGVTIEEGSTSWERTPVLRHGLFGLDSSEIERRRAAVLKEDQRKRRAKNKPRVSHNKFKQEEPHKKAKSTAEKNTPAKYPKKITSLNVN